MSKDNFGDRIKDYERLETGDRFMPLLPIYARIDGNCFSTFTRPLARPFEAALSEAMIETTKYLVAETHARLGYTQSDEISLVCLQDEYEQEMPFGGKKFKLESVLPSKAAAKFNWLCTASPVLAGRAATMLPAFDCRVFQLPNRTEAANAFLWREQDASKNAVSMAARAYYAHRELERKSGSMMQEMLFQKGVNFNDYPPHFKRGTFVRRQRVERRLSDSEWASIPGANRPPRDRLVTRSEIVVLDMPIFSTVVNREAVIFDGAEPMTAGALAA